MSHYVPSSRWQSLLGVSSPMTGLVNIVLRMSSRHQPDQQAKVDDSARERFIAYGLLRTSSKDHDHLKHALSDDFAKGGDTYPKTPQQSLLLLDKYSKTPTVIAQSEGTAFAQTGKKKGGAKKKSDAVDPKKVEFDKDFYKDGVFPMR